MCEEAENASTSIPNSLVASIGLNGVMGFAMLIAVLFCIGNVEEALKTPTGYPVIEIFRQATGSNAGGTGLMVVVLVFFSFANVSCLAAASRMMWAFARDRGLPGSALLSKVRTIRCMIFYLYPFLFSLFLARIDWKNAIIDNSLG